MEEPPDRMEEIRLNQLAQSVGAIEGGEEWFRARDLAKQRGILRALACFAAQAGAGPSDADAAIARSGLRPGHTPAVLLRGGRLRMQVAKILALPAGEHERAFRLLLALFAIADARRRSLQCSGGCSHSWHRDLSDSAVAASIAESDEL